MITTKERNTLFSFLENPTEVNIKLAYEIFISQGRMTTKEFVIEWLKMKLDKAKPSIVTKDFHLMILSFWLNGGQTVSINDYQLNTGNYIDKPSQKVCYSKAPKNVRYYFNTPNDEIPQEIYKSLRVEAILWVANQLSEEFYTQALKTYYGL